MDPFIRNYIRAIEAFGWDGGPEFNTDIAALRNKGEKRNAQWSQSRFFTSIPFQNILPEWYDDIADMFEDRMGRNGTFLYMNPIPSRHFASHCLIGIGDATAVEFQLKYVNSRGVARNVYAIYEPERDSSGRHTGEAVESEIVVRLDGVPTTAFTVDHGRGKIVFDSPPGMGAVVTWSGRFSHWVRFDQDRLPFSIDNKSADEYVMNGTVELIEVNPPKPGELSSAS